MVQGSIWHLCLVQAHLCHSPIARSHNVRSVDYALHRDCMDGQKSQFRMAA